MITYVSSDAEQGTEVRFQWGIMFSVERTSLKSSNFGLFSSIAERKEITAKLDGWIEISSLAARACWITIPFCDGHVLPSIHRPARSTSVRPSAQEESQVKSSGSQQQQQQP